MGRTEVVTMGVENQEVGRKAVGRRGAAMKAGGRRAEERREGERKAEAKRVVGTWVGEMMGAGRTEEVTKVEGGKAAQARAGVVRAGVVRAGVARAGLVTAEVVRAGVVMVGLVMAGVVRAAVEVARMLRRRRMPRRVPPELTAARWWCSWCLQGNGGTQQAVIEEQRTAVPLVEATMPRVLPWSRRTEPPARPLPCRGQSREATGSHRCINGSVTKAPLPVVHVARSDCSTARTQHAMRSQPCGAHLSCRRRM